MNPSDKQWRHQEKIVTVLRHRGGKCAVCKKPSRFMLFTGDGQPRLSRLTGVACIRHVGSCTDYYLVKPAVRRQEKVDEGVK